MSKKSIIENTLQLLQKYQLNREDYLISGSAALYLLGILKIESNNVPSDLDILIRDKHKFNLLKNNFNSTVYHTNGFSGSTINLCHQNEHYMLDFDLTSKWPIHGFNTEELFKRSSDVDNIRVISINHAIETMSQIGRPKDIDRLQVIANLPKPEY